jgi:hypothetical protein
MKTLDELRKELDDALRAYSIAARDFAYNNCNADLKTRDFAYDHYMDALNYTPKTKRIR